MNPASSSEPPAAAFQRPAAVSKAEYLRQLTSEKRDAARAFGRGLLGIFARQFNSSSALPKTLFGLTLPRALDLAGCWSALPSPAADGPQHQCYIPKPIALCTSYLSEHGAVQGIFRISAKASRVAELEARLNHVCLFHYCSGAAPGSFSGSDLAMTADINEFNWCAGYTAQEVAGVLKRYLNLLPEPLCTLALYDAFRSIDNTGEQAAYGHLHQQRLVRLLPIPSQHLLLHLLRFLHLMASHSDVTLMTAENLAIVFQNCILAHPRDQALPAEYSKNATIITSFVGVADILEAEPWPASDQHESAAALLGQNIAQLGGADAITTGAGYDGHTGAKVSRRATVVGTLSKRVAVGRIKPLAPTRPEVSAALIARSHDATATPLPAPVEHHATLIAHMKSYPAMQVPPKVKAADGAAKAASTTPSRPAVVLGRRNTLPSRIPFVAKLVRSGTDTRRWGTAVV